MNDYNTGEYTDDIEKAISIRADFIALKTISLIMVSFVSILCIFSVVQ